MEESCYMLMNHQNLLAKYGDSKRKKKKVQICQNPSKILAFSKLFSSKCGDILEIFLQNSLDHVAWDCFFFFPPKIGIFRHKNDHRSQPVTFLKKIPMLCHWLAFQEGHVFGSCVKIFKNAIKLKLESRFDDFFFIFCGENWRFFFH